MALDAFDIDVTDTIAAEMAAADYPPTTHAPGILAAPAGDGAPESGSAPPLAGPLATEGAETPKVNLSAAFREWATISDMMDDLQEKMAVLAGRRSDVLRTILESHGSGPFKFRGMELLIAKNKNGLGYCVRKLAKSPTVVE